jgi:photosystem II stability/assembly factor-like uncharacterized protein
MKRVWGLLARVSPWVLIAGLGYAAVYVKVAVKPVPMTQPLIEQRDQFLGGVHDGARYWFVGQDGGVLSMDAKTRQWQREELKPRFNLQGIAAGDDGVLVVVGNDGRLWVRGRSEQWVGQVLPVGDIARKLIDVAFLNGSFWVVGEMGALFRGTADGQTWTRMREPEDVAFNRVRSGPGGSLWIAAESGRLLHSDDDGNTWQSIELDSESLQSIAFVGDVALVVGNRGHVYRSDNAGIDWKQVPGFTSDNLFDVTGGPDGWMVVGDHGAVFTAGLNPQEWQNATARGLSKSYYMRVLASAHESVLIGHSIGRLAGNDTYESWPAGGHP